MSTNETERYNGWANRETWAVGLYIRNDQGWEESVHEALRDAMPESDCANCHEGVRGDGVFYRHTHADSDVLCGTGDGSAATPSDEHRATLSAWKAGEIIRENVEQMLTVAGYQEMTGEDRLPASLSTIAEDIGSLWRVDWTELGRSFLEDLADIDADEESDPDGEAVFTSYPGRIYLDPATGEFTGTADEGGDVSSS